MSGSSSLARRRNSPTLRAKQAHLHSTTQLEPDGRAAPTIDAITHVKRPNRRERDECVKIAATWVHLRTCLEPIAVEKPLAKVGLVGTVTRLRGFRRDIIDERAGARSLAILERLGDVHTRVIAVDKRMGIVWLRMAWGVRSQIHAVEAFMRILPVEKRNGGCE
jgi:hypothetical protein